MNKYFLIALVVTACLASCGNKRAEPEAAGADFSEAGLMNTKTNAEFEKFYRKFLTDSVYQMQHTQFPLAGGVFECEEVIDWQTEGWSMMRDDIRSFDPELDSLITGFSGTTCRLSLYEKKSAPTKLWNLKKLVESGNWCIVRW